MHVNGETHPFLDAAVRIGDRHGRTMIPPICIVGLSQAMLDAVPPSGLDRGRPASQGRLTLVFVKKISPAFAKQPMRLWCLLAIRQCRDSTVGTTDPQQTAYHLGQSAVALGVTSQRLDQPTLRCNVESDPQNTFRLTCAIQ